MSTIPQFGHPHGTFIDRPGAYAVIFDADGKLLTVLVREKYHHLPGGGIDNGEDPEAAVAREVREETGYEVGSLERIGEANQFFETTALGPMNKRGVYFLATVDAGARGASVESDHRAMWIDPHAFLDSSAEEFHRWAVRRALEKQK